MRWPLALSALLLLAVAGACGNQITVPDQGVIVLGCQLPSACFLTGAACACSRDVSACMQPLVCTNPDDRTTCSCPSVNVGDLGMVATVCRQAAQVCVGRSPTVCPGAGARCLPVGGSCASAGGDPPNLVHSGGATPALEPHCAFVDDVCCPGVSGDGGATDGGIPDGSAGD